MNQDSEAPNPSELGRALFGSEVGSKPSSPWLPPTPEELQKVLPGYQIIKMLGCGGMGAVYMGKQISLDRAVAIKVLANDLAAKDPSFAERFKNEAHAMAKLSHLGIVAVHDFGETDGGLLYIVMEYVDGTDVARMIAADGRLHTQHAMAITAHVCDALAYAHERGIVHRDIKPANIMVGFDGVVKVADFGLAKVNSESAIIGLTQSGMAMGTMHFMAPEMFILGSGNVDLRADVYAVGVMLYQMLTGKVPHGMFELPSHQVKGLDPRYDDIIAKAMREDRDQRYQSATDLRRDLDAILTQPVVKVDPEVSQAPAALPTMARPKRPGAGQPYRPPQSVVHRPQSPAKSFNVWLVWAVLGLFTLGGGFLWLHRNGQGRKNVVAPYSDQTAPSPSRHSPATSTKDASFVNSLDMKFAAVPGTAIWFCVHETRWRDFEVFATSNAINTEIWREQAHDGFSLDTQKEDHPVVNVNFDDAQAFCRWLAEKEGRDYRLPTDREWSVAAGLADQEDWRPGTAPSLVASKQLGFPWGTGWPPPKGFGNYSDESRKRIGGGQFHISGYDDGFPTTSPVMSFVPNAFGLYDMSGNVWEWCSDRFDANREERGLRGGSWHDGQEGALRVSRRTLYLPDQRNSGNGFRIVLDLGNPKPPVARDSKAVATSPPVPETKASLPVVSTPAFDLTQSPDFRTRVANYQKARHAQLSELSGKYRNALTAARAEVVKGGVLADVTALDEAITRATALADEIEKNLNSMEVKPLSALPELSATVPQRLKDLRAIFERETAKIETTLVTSLDQSLATVQTSLVQATNLEAAKAVEEFRSRMKNAFVASQTGVVSTTGLPKPPESAPIPLSEGSTPFPTPKLVDVKRIWNQAPQNQYTDLIFHNGSWLCVFRESVQNSATSKGSIRVIGSSDGNEWSSLSLISDPNLDLRDPKITATPDGRLMLNSAGKIPRNRNFVQSKAWFSTDGGSIWSEAADIGDQGFWLWRVVPHHDALYSIGYSTPLLNPPRLYRSQDGKNYESFVSALALPQTSTEGSLLFRSDGSSIALIRHDTGDKHSFVGTASPPYNSWSWRKLDRQVGGPNLIELPTGHILVAGRFYEPTQHMALHWLTLGPDHVEREECLRLPSEIQTGYPGLVWENDLLWVSYYSSHEGSPSIYLARAAFTDSGAPSNPMASASRVNPPYPTRPTNESPTAALANATKGNPFVNSLGMKFVPVPGTKVLMCIHETRKGDYRVYADASPGSKRGWETIDIEGEEIRYPEDHPVSAVTYQGAEAFCAWLGGKESITYRLPTDREWSLAAGLGSIEKDGRSLVDLSAMASGTYPWGKGFPPPKDVGNLADSALTQRFPRLSAIPGYADGHATTAPVMSFKPNNLGVYDLAGNVWEWCADWWDAAEQQRIIRGGSWRNDEPKILDASFRGHVKSGVAPSSIRHDCRGFRIVIELP